MRNEKTIELDANRLVVIRELRVKDVRQILTIFTPEKAQQSIPDLVRTHLPDFISLTTDSLALPDGETIDDLTLSECEEIGRAWWDMHSRFFAPLLAVVKEQGNAAISTAPA
ncbi:hypothetical protein [Chromatium okenii]|jgi:hypothetical protein|uniref:hypothetical protein n=1 Tax=Chromatium okenii TaxID=61644 RepID=UPI0026ECB3D0|nr:hypothetical protein [Chromatium okenii]MBV5310823.1 hypothetical protein [Chromatium okenii]